MSDNGPYQSRLLNLLVPQYRWLVEKGARAIRQMKVAVSWAAQVVIYPVYLLLQTTRLAFRQLGQAVKSQLPQLREEAPDVDRPIQEVLLAVLPEEGELVLTPDVVGLQSPKPNVPQHWDLIVNNTPLVMRKQQEKADSLPPATPRRADPRGGYKGQVIRGVATELTSKNLILVTADNQELDIFTQQQQKELQQLIIWQLAKYRRYLRQLAMGKRPPTWGKLAASKTTLLPIRLLGQVMAWEQKGTVARAIDLCGESSLVHQPSRELAQGEPEAIAYLSKLDSFIAYLECQISIIRESSREIEGKTRERTETPSQTESVTDGSDRENQNIFALIISAIAYFFGNKRGDKHLSADSDSVDVKQLTGKGMAGATLARTELPFSEGRMRCAHATRSGWEGIKNQVRRIQYYSQLLRDNNQQEASQRSTGNQAELYRSEVKALCNSQASEVTDGKTREKQNIFAHIGAAIAYFFGNKRGDKNLPGTADEQVQQLTGSKKSGSEKSSSDARTLREPSATRLPVLRERRLTGAEKALTPLVGKSVKNHILRILRRPEQAVAQPQTFSREAQSSSQVEVSDWVSWSDVFGTLAEKGRKQAVAQRSGAATAESVGSMVAITSGWTPDQQAPGDNIYIELTPDWIETAATPNGYVKHPLEKILAWLDRGILWLEERAIGIWKWFRGQ
ncbi:MAG: hypothetical protein GDA43_04840 [Hormoscilla sp. SP5CHS1]|nr:hypothetical protein [Hormoscilla sp. SP12CHS1]MBC6452594.1 hypothetical protein [Hormoscilla sp. SP5CHS1]